jgi:hypothetical protein
MQICSSFMERDFAALPAYIQHLADNQFALSVMIIRIGPCG